MNKNMRNGIRAFVAKVNPNIDVKFQKWDLEANVFEETVYIGKTYDKRTDEYFKNFVNELNPACRTINPFLLSVLHEIGHLITWTDEDAEMKDVIYELLKVKYDNEKIIDDDKMREYCNEYFRIPLELKATIWGINYALAHLDLMTRFDWLHN